MHMARPFKNRLRDSGPAVSFLWRTPGKDYHGERFLLWFLIPVKGDRLIGLGEATGQGLGGVQLRTRKFMGTWGKDKARSQVQGRLLFVPEDQVPGVHEKSVPSFCSVLHQYQKMACLTPQVLKYLSAIGPAG